ncbi:MAG: homocitrate synthase/isopropylmalate synthase family protein [Thermoproteota archaeon]
MNIGSLGFKQLPLKTEPVIDDTTLRDGMQMPGLSVSPQKAANIARLLDQIGVERIELHHFQRQDKKAAKIIQDMSLNASIAGWCRALKEDVDAAIETGFEDIGVSHPISPIHLKSKWPNKTKDQLLHRVVEAVEYAAKDHGLRVFVHGEDSTRAEWNFEKRFINAVAEAGAECYRICDTVGVALSSPDAPLPAGIPAKIKAIKEETDIQSIEIHTHDDLGNAVENTMAAIRSASGIWEKVYASTTFLGIGERSGNAETEKVIMNLLMHHNVEKFKDKTKNLKKTADYISKATGYVIPPNKGIVGDYAFAHESGIHTHGVLSNTSTYEPYPPELVGNERRLTVGKQSGKAIVRHKIKEITNKTPSRDTVKEVLKRIKELYAQGRKASLKDEEFKEILKEKEIL